MSDIINKLRCIFKHDYDYVGAYYQECRPKPLDLYGIEVFRLYRCTRCGKYCKERIIKHSTTYGYDIKIKDLKENGYKHLNTYYEDDNKK